MVTRVFDIRLSVPCDGDETEDAATAAVLTVSRQLFAVAQMLSARSPARLTVTYSSSRTGRRTIDIAKLDDDTAATDDAHSSGARPDVLGDRIPFDADLDGEPRR